MNAALDLFRSVGYQKTMIIDITKKVSAAKGNFYHYYPSKEAIVQAIATAGPLKWPLFQVGKQSVRSLSQAGIVYWTPVSATILFKNLWAEEHLNLYYKTWRLLVEDIFNPLLAEIIQQGNQEGSMHVACQQQALAFFWSTLACVWEAILFQDPPDIFASKAKMAQSLLVHILGIEEDAFEISLTGYWIV